jgi:predicted nucleotidyltransferase
LRWRWRSNSSKLFAFVIQDFDRLLHRLADSGLDFVIIGGFAAVTHGSALVTRDLDICVLLTNETVEKLRTILADWHPRHRMTPQKLSFLEFPKTGPVQNLYLETDFGIVDILSFVLGVGDFPRLRNSAEEFQIGNRTYRVISLDDLITAKEAVGREKDLLAAKELRAIAAKRREQ